MPKSPYRSRSGGHQLTDYELRYHEKRVVSLPIAMHGVDCSPAKLKKAVQEAAYVFIEALEQELDKVNDFQTVYLDHPRIIITKVGG